MAVPQPQWYTKGASLMLALDLHNLFSPIQQPHTYPFRQRLTNKKHDKNAPECGMTFDSKLSKVEWPCQTPLSRIMVTTNPGFFAVLFKILQCLCCQQVLHTLCAWPQCSSRLKHCSGQHPGPTNRPQPTHRRLPEDRCDQQCWHSLAAGISSRTAHKSSA